MFKNSFKDPFLTNECKDYYFSDFPSTDIYIVSMSSDKLPPSDLDLIEEIIRNPPTSTHATSEEEQDPGYQEQIRHLEEVLINEEVPSRGSHTITGPQFSTESFGQLDELLLNPRDHNLIDMDEMPITCTAMTNSRSPDLIQSGFNVSPVSPETEISQIIDTLTIDSMPYTIDSSPVITPPNVESSPNVSGNPSVISSRIRFDSSGATYEDGTPVMESLYPTSLNTNTLQPLAIRSSTRGAHSALPYGRSWTEPLPEFGAIFRASTGSHTTPNINLQSVSNFPGVNTLSPPLGQSQYLPYPLMERSFSEPILPNEIRVLEYPNRSTTNSRGRPVTRHQSRRQPTARERREQLDNELTAQEITRYELDHRFRYLYNVTQYFRRRLRESGYTEGQLDEMLTQFDARFNPEEGPI